MVVTQGSQAAWRGAGVLPALPALLRLRVSVRFAARVTDLPPFKGSILRGVLGRALEGASPPGYRALFGPDVPPGVSLPSGLGTPPRPYVIEPPADNDAGDAAAGRTRYAAGEPLDFHLTLIGRGEPFGVDTLRAVLDALDALDAVRGRRRADAAVGRAGRDELPGLDFGQPGLRVRVERVEAVAPGAAFGLPLAVDGVRRHADRLPPVVTVGQLDALAAALAPDLRLQFVTPLALDRGGAPLRELDPPTLIRRAADRLDRLAALYGGGPGPLDPAGLEALAAGIRVEAADLRPTGFSRTSHQGQGDHRKRVEGLIGSATLRGVPYPLRAVLLAASLVHVGTSCTEGFGCFRVTPLGGMRAPISPAV